MRVFAAVFLCGVFAFAQTDASPSSQKARAIAAVGGMEALSTVKDYTATGTITFFEGDVRDSGTVSIKARGPKLLRFDSVTSSGARSWVVLGPTARAKEGERKAVALSADVAQSLRHYALPVSILAQADTANLKASADALTQNNSAGKPLVKVSASKYGFDPESGCIVRVSTEVRARAGVAPIQQEFVYSEFHAVDGVLFPFVIEEWDAGVKISRVELKQITLNTGLSATDFQLE